ncbi:hypothetical protein [Nannocystis punicea]|uniref:DUF883 domain-containing protein n=1 Tax=Nannocystis punicea TaxID=2995304 RepID=A0ABY7H655_9BACT|nr:hypothetical protein [Nannocystis poenicansa]WAS94761.1 hypothetical protein O0S08_01260 [Nannocystis poenicansa]
MLGDRNFRCDLGRERSSFSREMSPNQASRTFTMTTLAAGLLALVALGVAGVGFSDYLRVQKNIARSRDELEQAKVDLSQVKYDEHGDVVVADNSRFEWAMITMETHTNSIRDSRRQESNTYPYIGGGVLGFLVFTFMAVRSTRRS